MEKIEQIRGLLNDIQQDVMSQTNKQFWAIYDLRAKLTAANAEIERIGDELTEARERIAELEKKGE
jgi:uncharacterized coiled-coil DUF342 family protein